MMYFGLATHQCFICAQPYQLEWSGCCVDGLDSLCDNCITKLWNGESKILDEMPENYSGRIQELEANLPPEIGPARQSAKREIMALREMLQVQDRETILRDILEEVAELKRTNRRLDEVLRERRSLFAVDL